MTALSLPSLLVSVVAMAMALVVLTFHAHTLSYGDKPLPYQITVDSDAYIKIAMGHLAEVESPFSKRILYPYAVGKAANWLHLELPQAFMAANFLCWALLAYCVAAILEQTVGRPYFALIPLLTAFGYESLALAYLPDLFHAAFTALFFLLLLKKQRWWAYVVLFLLCLARDNTFFLCVVTSWVAFREGDRELGKGALLVFVLGVITSSMMARYGKPNIHHLWEPFYLAGKIPYNVLGNLFGVVMWSNLRAGLGVPWVVWHVPPFLHHFMKDREIGIIFMPHQIYNTFIVLLTIFGSAPLILHFTRRTWPDVRPPLAIQLALVYGGLSYILGIALGNWTFRLIGYGWPAFWLALPWVLAKRNYRPPAWKAVLLLICFWGLSWLPSLTQLTWAFWYAIPPLVVLFYAITIVCLRSFKRDLKNAARLQAAQSG